MKTQRSFHRRLALVGAFAAGALAAPALELAAEQTYSWGEQYRRLLPQYRAMIERSEQAFVERDVAAIAESLDADFSWYRVTDAGPVEMVRGRDATVELLDQFFASPAWTTNDSEVHRLGMVGNTLVQVEIDTLQGPEGPRRQTSLHVYEFRDGRRFREFAFYPQVADPADPGG